MAFDLRKISNTAFAGLTALGLVMSPIAATQATAQQPQTVAATATSQIDFPVSDARNIAPNAVRIVAGQGTEQRPSIALFGVAREAWPTLREAIQQSIANGYPISAVFMGPTDAPPDLVIYSKGTRMTKPINPNTFSRQDLIDLIKAVYEDDGLKRVAQAYAGPPSYDQ